ncbi:MAG: hypothetical protein E6Y30_06865 [Finegoldia magna]|jgi:hypothetical protein|nr:hypothetical protein [Finegoldia magna]DAP17628.1 MAG TPA: tail component [Caudoviricetes sp.]DAX32471.1 MAG TPA: tail component [Caudoviricetes sp.]
MINVKPLIYKELAKIATNVTDTYPADWETFPVVIYLEEENKPHEWLDNGVEETTYLRYKVDIFDKESTSNIAVEVDKVFSSLGLKRTMAQDMPDPSNLRHKVMRFEGIYDPDTNIVYQYRMEG